MFWYYSLGLVRCRINFSLIFSNEISDILNGTLWTLEGCQNKAEAHRALFFFNDRNGQTCIYKPLAGLLLVQFLSNHAKKGEKMGEGIGRI